MAKTHPIAAYRKREKLTVAQLAYRLGVDRITVWRWENKRRRPDDRLLPTVSAVTGIPITVLMNLREGAE